MKALVWDGNGIEVVFPYDPNLVAAIKSVPGRRFDAVKKCWVVPLATMSANALLNFAAHHEFSVDERIAGQLKELAAKAGTDPRAIASAGTPVIAVHPKGLGAYFNYDPVLVNAIREVPGRVFDENEKVWVLPETPEAAHQIVSLVKGRGFMVLDEAADHINALTKLAEEAQAHSRAADADIDIPVNEGLSYMGFQRAGIRYASSRQNALIADEPGLGKTIQSIGVANMDESIRSVLVVCTASIKTNWKREWQKWCTKGLSVGVANTKEWPETDVVITNYDLLKSVGDKVRARPWDLLIVDEAHYVKNPKAQRTKHILGYKKEGITPIGARRKLFLTGTPILNRPDELWTLVHALAPQVFRDWRQFVTRYCGAHQDGWGTKMGEPANLDELQEKLRSSVMVRRLKKDVLSELPPKIRQIIEIEDPKLLKGERKAMGDMEQRLLDLRVQVELAKAAGEDDAYSAAVETLRDAQSKSLELIGRVRHDTAMQKVPFVVQHVQDAIENGKVILFAHHKDVIESFRRVFFEQCIVIDGSVDPEERQGLVDEFQTNPECRVAIVSIRAGREGLTMTASSHVIFAELDLTPGGMTQAEDRAHRIGQRDAVLVQHVVLSGSVDAGIAKMLVAKQETIEKALNRQTEHVVEQVEGGVVDMGPLPEVASINVSEAMASEPPTTASTTRTELQALAETITDAQAVAIHQALRVMARVCDGAAVEDSVGFNRFDTRMGHLLAAAPEISKLQAALGRKMLTKYRRQLGDEMLESMGVAPAAPAPKKRRPKKESPSCET